MTRRHGLLQWGMRAALLAVALHPDRAHAAPPARGQRLEWHVSLRAELLGDTGGSPGAVVIDGEWQRTVVAVRPDGYDVRVQLAAVRLGGGQSGNVPADALRLAQERLSKPFWLTVANDGTLEGVHFLPEMAVSDRNLLQTIATEAQFAGGAGDRAVWTTTERDGGGRYMAIYQRRDPLHVRKKKLQYLEADGGGGAQALTMTIQESQSDFTLTPEGAVAAVDSTQQVRLRVSGMQGNALTTRLELHVSDLRVSVERSPLALLAPPPNAEHRPIVTHQTDPETTRAGMDAQLLAGQRSDDILAAAPRNDAMSGRRLSALFRQRPESIGAATTRLLAGGADSQAIAGALADANSAASIRALRDVAATVTNSVAARTTALMAIEGIRAPGPEVIRFPERLLDDGEPQVRNAARLTAGALAHAGRSAHPGAADAVEALLVARFTRAPTIAAKQAYLAALGNSAGARAAAVMMATLKEPSPGLRTAAARGLRLVPGAEADTVLAATLATDGSDAVREAALFAIGFRTPLSDTLWSAVVAAGRADRAGNVRSRVVSLVRGASARPPEADAMLAWVAEHDPVETVRAAALESLAAVRKTGPQR